MKLKKFNRDRILMSQELFFFDSRFQLNIILVNYPKHKVPRKTEGLSPENGGTNR